MWANTLQLFVRHQSREQAGSVYVILKDAINSLVAHEDGVNRMTQIFQAGKKISQTVSKQSSDFIFFQAVESFKKSFDDQSLLIFFFRFINLLTFSNGFRGKTCLLVDFANAYKSAQDMP